MEKNRKLDVLTSVLIVGLGIYQILRCLDYPGMYLDAVNPDYLAVQLLFPEIQNPAWAIPHSGFPLLGQLYHGTVTIWLQVLLIGITGQASVLTLRLANMLYVMGICQISYLILKKAKVNKGILFGYVVLLMLSPQVFSFVRTQYYIKLPGTLLLLCAIYFLLSSERVEKKALFLIFSGVLNGLAFYSYFIYLFFVPGMLIFCFWQSKKTKSNCIKDILVWLTGFCYGCIPYVIGYFDFLITKSAFTHISKRNIVIIFAVLLFTIGSCLLLMLIKRFEDTNFIFKIYRVIGLCAGIALLLLMLCSPLIIATIKPLLESLNVAGTKMDFADRVRQILLFWNGIMSNKFSEELMLGGQKSIWHNIYIYFFVVCIVLVVVTLCRFKKNISDQIKVKLKLLCLVWLLLISYAICSLLFISRMGGQHFTPIFFLSILAICVELDIIEEVLIHKTRMYFSYVCIILLISIGIVNSGIISANLAFTGGNNLFTSQINELAEDALERRSNGEKEYYIFPEWGFMCGFNYLTMNQIPYTTSIDVKTLQNYIDEGYSFRLCFWQEEDIESYMETLEDAGIDDITVEMMCTNSGDSAFYMLVQE